MHILFCVNNIKFGTKCFVKVEQFVLPFITPRVSASGQAGIETPWLNLSYSFLFSGKRYMLGQNISDNRLDSYSDHSISAYRDFKIQKVTASLNLEVLNLMNRNYEIVKNFPMPGRSVRVTIGVRY